MHERLRLVCAVLATVFLAVMAYVNWRDLRKKGGVAMSFKHELGSKVRDKITTYEGTVIGRSEWLYGCRRYVVQARELTDGKPVEPLHADEDQLEVLEAAAPYEVKSIGGPQQTISRGSEARR